jgi:predicted HTH domain antitoxin
MKTAVTVEVPNDVFGLLDEDPVRFARDMYETAVVKWFDEGRISQGKAAELLGLSRGELFDLLGRHKVSPIQMTAEELAEELRSGRALGD